MNEIIKTETVTVTAITSLEISEMTGKDHKHVLRDIRDMLEELEIGQTIFGQTYLDSQNKKQPMFVLPKREALILASGYDVKLRAKIIDRLEELEKPTASIPQTYIEALEALVIAEKLKQNAIDTKAEIGHRREATAMNTASQKVKEAKKLQIALDQSQEFATTKRVEITTGNKFGWHKLKKVSKANGYPIKKVFDVNYGTINSYYFKAWEEAYGVDIREEA